MREKRQAEAVESYRGGRELIIAAPRLGKIKVTLDILKRMGKKKVLVVYPRKDIQNGWDADIQKWGYTGDVTYTTTTSLKKVAGDDWDMIVLDEIHEYSDNVLKQIGSLKCKDILGLSGTVGWGTMRNITYHTNIVPCYEYTIEQAVKEGILCDYQIIIHKTPLDNEEKDSKGRTEKRRFDSLNYVYSQLKEQKKDNFHIYLKQIQLIQGSHAKVKKTKALIQKFSKDANRILVFCGTTAVADILGIEVYHSKKKEQGIFESFCQGKEGYDSLATIKMAQAGVTIKPIQKGIINYTSGNPEETAQKICRFLGLEYENSDKKAEIHIISSTEKFETDRLHTALSFFDQDKITYT